MIKAFTGARADASTAHEVRAALERLGISAVQGPRPELPDVLVTTLPEPDLDRYLQDVKDLDGVSYVELESLYQAHRG